MPEASSDPEDIIYLLGNNTLYLRPYLQTEYNDLCYAKLLDPQNEGHNDLWRWVNARPIEGGTIEVIKEGQKLRTIPEKKYYVEQTQGPELGYTIVEYQAERHQHRGPSLVGHRVEFGRGDGDPSTPTQ